MALLPPMALAFVTNSLEFLVGITGSYAGAGIQYVVPALLVYNGRKVSTAAIGIGVRAQKIYFFIFNRHMNTQISFFC